MGRGRSLVSACTGTGEKPGRLQGYVCTLVMALGTQTVIPEAPAHSVLQRNFAPVFRLLFHPPSCTHVELLFQI